MRALSFLAPKGLRQKRISQEQFAKPGKLTAISCFFVGFGMRAAWRCRAGSGAAKATLNAIPVRCSKSIFIQLEALQTPARHRHAARIPNTYLIKSTQPITVSRT